MWLIVTNFLELRKDEVPRINLLGNSVTRAILTSPCRLSSPTHLRRPDRLEDEPLPPRTDDLLQPVAIQHVGLVHQHRDLGRSLVGGRASRLYGLLPRLPQAERETLA